MPDVNLNWDSTAVKDGRLVVELDGEVTSEWKNSFATTVRLLGSHQWGQVQLKKKKVHVDSVAAGMEEKLRHYLESVVGQANALQRVDEEEEEEEEEEPGARETESSEEPSGPDAELTGRFRSFAATSDGDSGDEG